MLLWYLLVIVAVVLCLLVRFLSHALDRRKELVHRWPRGKTFRRTHSEAIRRNRHIRFCFFCRIHLSSTNVLRRDDSGLVLESDLVLSTLGDQVGILLAGSVEEIEFLAPIAVALRFCTIVAAWLILIALEVPFSARQTPCARSFGFAFRRGIAFPFFRRLVAGRIVPGRRRENDSTSHSDNLVRAFS